MVFLLIILLGLLFFGGDLRVLGLLTPGAPTGLVDLLAIFCATAWSSSILASVRRRKSLAVERRISLPLDLISGSSLSPSFVERLLRGIHERIRFIFSFRELLRSASAATFSSASWTILFISSSDNPPEDLMTTLCSLPVPLSFAETFKMPSASMSNETDRGVPAAPGVSLRGRTVLTVCSPRPSPAHPATP